MSKTNVQGNISLGANSSDYYEKLPTSLQDRASHGNTLSDQMVSMRDGIRLATDIYLPAGDGPFPAILTRLPYGKTDPWPYMPVIADFWVRQGYAVVVQDVRGKWNSEGEFNPNFGEQEDGYDTLEWISNQPWSNRKVGMWGESYYGFTCYAAATTQHPALACIAPANISVDRFAATLRYGCLQLNTVGTWAIVMADQTYQDVTEIDYWHLPLVNLARKNGVHSDYYEEMLGSPARSEFWQQRSVLSAYENVRIPVLHMAGWYDNYLGPSIVDWKRMADNCGELHNHHLFVGPWDHCSTVDQTGRVGELPVEGPVTEYRWETICRFFDRYLMEIENGFDDAGRVQYFAMGRNQWRNAETWPPAEVRMTPVYLHSNGHANTLDGDGVLSWSKPDVQTYDSFIYDPNDPVADTLDIDCWSISEFMGDRRKTEARHDVLVYTTETLDEGLELTGPIKAYIYFSSSAVDTDVTVSLVDVRPDGHGNLIQDGILRTRCRNGIDNPELMVPGETYKLEVDVWSTSYFLNPGHRLRVEISSSCFNRYDRNLNTGEDLGVGAEPIKATQTIYHDSDRPSHMILPIRE